MPYFTISKTFLLPSFELPLKERAKLDALLSLFEQSGIAQYLSNDDESTGLSLGGRPSYNPYRLFATIAYAFAKHSGSLRKIEESILFDLRFIYLMEQDHPSYVTLSKFLNNIIVKFHKEIYASIIKTILNNYNISIDDCFLDGTKLEANANKYKFVWKPTTFHKVLNQKAMLLINKYNPHEISPSQFLKAKDIGLALDHLAKQIQTANIDLSNIQVGRGHRHLPLVADYLTLEKYLLKTLEYEEKETLCGNDRNSYYKTDHDATAMCLKQDYYSGLGSNMHAGYNAQIIVAKGIILSYYVSQDRNDFYTLIPSIEGFFSTFNVYPKRLCADSGYGSYYNYSYLDKHHIENFVKYNEWANERSGRKFDLFSFDELERLVCLNKHTAVGVSTLNMRHVKSKDSLLYKIDNCKGCRLKKICQLSLKDPTKNYRVFEVNLRSHQFKLQARTNLLSVKGIEMRVNRSSQVEGAFGVIKQDMEYTRARRRGLINVETEFMLVCLGYTLRKFFLLFEGTAKMDYWHAPADLKSEGFPEPKLNKTYRKKTLSNNEKNKKDYKYRKKAVKSP